MSEIPTKFMPELVSVDELEVLAAHYESRLRYISLNLIGLRDEDPRRKALLEEKDALLCRHDYLSGCARHRRQLEKEFAPARPKNQR